MYKVFLVLSCKSLKYSKRKEIAISLKYSKRKEIAISLKYSKRIEIAICLKLMNFLFVARKRLY